MTKTPSDRMNTEPLQDPNKICEGCPHRGRPLPNRRAECASCRKIFKGDLLQLLEESLKDTNYVNLTPGRKPTRHKTHGKLVKKLRARGHNYTQIGELTGLHYTTIKKILKEDI